MQPSGDPVLLDLVDPAPVIPLLKEVLGGDIRMRGVQPRTFPPEDQGGYTAWHRDAAKPDNYPGPSPAHIIKMFFYFFDVPENGGCTAVVPGSHKILSHPGRVFDKVWATSRTHDTEESNTISTLLMPNQVKFAVSAGTAIIFNTAIWHTALPNTSTEDRQCVIIRYHSRTGGMPPGLVVSGSSGLTPSTLQQLAQKGLLNDERREILGADDDQPPAGSSENLVFPRGFRAQ